MINKDINHLVGATVDSLNGIKKTLGSTALATTLVATSFFTGVAGPANAADTIFSTGDIWDGTLNTNLAAADDIIVNGTVTLTFAGQSVTGRGAEDGVIILGDAPAHNGTEAVIVDINSTAALTFDRDINEVAGGGAVATIKIDDDASGTAVDTVTFSENVGNSVVLNALTVGTAGGTGGHAIFAKAANFGAMTLAGGDAGEVSIIDLRGAQAGDITITDSDSGAKVIVSGSTSSTIAGAILGAGDNQGTLQVTGANKVFSAAIGATGLKSFDLDESATINNTFDSRIVDIATAKTLTIDDDFTGDATTLNGTGGITFSTDGSATISALIGVIDAAADGNGTLTYTNTGQSTQTGNIGGTTGIGTIAVGGDGLIDIVGVVDTQNLTVAEGGIISFDRAATHDAAVLTTTGKIEYLVNPNGAAAQLVTGTINGAAANNGVIVTNNSNTVTFASGVGTGTSVKTITLTTQSIFNAGVEALGLTTAQSQVNQFKGDLTIGTSKFVITGAAGEAMFNASTDQTITGLIEGAGAEQGVIDNANTAGTVTFTGATGTVQLKEIELDADTTTVFKGLTKTALLDAAGTVTFEKKDNVLDDFDFGADSKLYIDDASIVAGDTVFVLSADGDATSLVDGMEIYMPANLGKGDEIKLFTTVTDDATAVTIAGDANTSLNDTAVIDYVASSTDDDVHITAVAKSTSTIASEQKITTNQAKSLSEAFSASILGDSGAQTAFETVFNAGSASTTNADFAKQLAPQTDTISGSSVATRAMTGTVQGIVSNRMASLRSGDAYVTGMSAGNGMSANSGFIQAFGSESEQKNTKSKGATVFGFDSDTSGVAIGFDGMTDNGSTLGLSASYSTTDVDGKGTGKSKNSIDSYTVSVYADKATDNGYIEGSLTYGINDNTASRLVNTAGLDRTYSANYDSSQISLKVGGGVPNEVTDSTFVTPFASATATSISTDAYTETSATADDALRLKVAQDDINSLVGTVGVKAHMVTDKGTPMISLALNNEFGDNQINSNNTYQGGGTKFKTTTDVEELSATLGLGYSFGNDVTSLNINYEANANDDEYVSHYGSVKIVAKF
jgi:uncharacterized protein with beta-barrel porin domain